VALLASWGITLYTLRLLIELHECVPGVRFDRYRDLARRARAGPASGAVGGGAAAARRAGRLRRGVHGDRRQVPAEVRGVRVRRRQLHQSYWICIFGGSQFLLAQLPNLDAITAVSFAAAAMSLSYSTVSWAACLARGPVGGVSYAYHAGGLGVPRVRRAGAGGVRVRGARRGAGNPGHGPAHAHQAVQGAHVEGHRRGLRGHRDVLLPRRVRRVLDVRARRRRQLPRVAAAAHLARRRGQHDGGRPRHRKLPGVRHADIRGHGDDPDHQVQGPSRSAPPSRGSLDLRR
jgi:hypothetical protein